MQIDMGWLRENFARFNTRYFSDTLPVPRFHVGHSRTRLGSMSFKRKVQPFGRTRHYDFSISLSNFYDQTEYQFQSVLLHEMIHLSIACSGIKDTSPHGVVFRGMMQRLNREGWNIRVMTSTKGYKKAHAGSTTVISQYLVLAIETRDGYHFLSSVNPKFARELHAKLHSAREITHFAWFTTSDHWFEDMPKVRSLRGRRVTPEVYTDKTAAMTPVSF